MSLLPLNDVAKQIGVSPDQIHAWISERKLTDHEGQVDCNAAKELWRIQIVSADLKGVSDNAEAAKRSLADLKASIPVSDPKWYRNSTLAASTFSAVAAILALVYASWQLGNSAEALRLSQQAFEAQAQYTKAQTAYTFQKDVIDRYLALSRESIGVVRPQEALIQSYTEQLGLGKQLADSKVIDATFWQNYRAKVCKPFQAPLCGASVSYARRTFVEEHKSIGESLANLCFPGLKDGDDICRVNF